MGFDCVSCGRDSYLGGGCPCCGGATVPSEDRSKKGEQSGGSGVAPLFILTTGLGLLMQVSALFLESTGRPPSGRVPGSGRQAGLHPSWSGRCSRLRRADACLVPSQSLARRSWSPCPAHLVPSGGTADAGRQPGCPALCWNDLGSGGARPQQAVSETTGIEQTACGQPGGQLQAVGAAQR